MPKPTQKSYRTELASLILLFFAGMACRPEKEAATPTATSQVALAPPAASCPIRLTPSRREAILRRLTATSSLPMVFVDAAIVELDSSQGASDWPAALEPRSANWRTDSRFNVLWSAHVMTASGAAGNLSMGHSAADRCAAYQCWSFSVMPHVPAPNAGELSLDVVLDFGSGSSDAGDGGRAEALPEPRRVQTTLVARDQQATLHRLNEEAGPILVVTPYVIQSREDLEQLSSCELPPRDG